MKYPGPLLISMLLLFGKITTGQSILSNDYSTQPWYWSVSVKGGKSNPDSRAWLWIPPSCKKIKAVILAQNNMEECSILENKNFRQTLSDLGFAEIWASPPFDHSFRFTEGAGDVFNKMMNDLADSSGYTELKYTPVIGIGHSAAASWPYYFAAWNPGRTLACISVSGQWPYFRHPSFAPDIWSKDQNIDFIPSLETMGEYEAADTWSAEGLKERKDHPFIPLSMLACPAEGHFAASQKKIDYIALYIRKVAQYRLPDYDPLNGPPLLKKIDPTRSGWLMDKWRAGQDPSSPSAPVGKYKGHPTQAFWFFDKEMVRATEKYESSYRHQKTPLLGYVQQGQVAQQHNTHLQVSLRPLTEKDGISFSLKGAFLDTVPGESPRPASWTGLPAGSKVSHPDDAAAISIHRVSGPFEKINDTLFRLALDKSTYQTPHSYTFTFVAIYPGNETWKPAVQQAEMVLPAVNTEGAEQHISFPPVPDQEENAAPIQLAATSDAGLPVSYYILEGPAEIKGNSLHLTQLPPRTRFPVKVTVVAWQYGRSTAPKIRTATCVPRSFFIIQKDHLYEFYQSYNHLPALRRQPSHFFTVR